MATFILDSDASLTDESLDETEIDFSDEDSPGAERILLPRNVSTEKFYMITRHVVLPLYEQFVS